MGRVVKLRNARARGCIAFEALPLCHARMLDQVAETMAFSLVRLCLTLHYSILMTLSLIFSARLTIDLESKPGGTFINRNEGLLGPCILLPHPPAPLLG